MKRLKESLPVGVLSNRIEYITAMDFRKGPGDVLLQAQLGKTFVITKQGKPVAALQPLPAGLTVVVKRDGSVAYEL